MRPWVSFVIVGTLWTLLVWLRSKRYGRDERSSRPSSRSSQRIAPRPSSTGPGRADPDRRFGHVSICPWCSLTVLVPFDRTQLEPSPWRIEWYCDGCGNDAAALVPSAALDLIRTHLRPGGIAVSPHEVEAIARASLAELDAAVLRELG